MSNDDFETRRIVIEPLVVSSEQVDEQPVEEEPPLLPTFFSSNLKLDYFKDELGNDFYSLVKAEKFPSIELVLKNEQLMQFLFHPHKISNEDCVEYFGRLHRLPNCISLAYHGYQFGVYNPRLGDGRAFLLGKIELSAQEHQSIEIGSKW